MKTFPIVSTLVLSICLFTSCDSQNVNAPESQKLNREAYYGLKETLTKDLNNLGSEFRKYGFEQKQNVSMQIA